MKQTVFLIAITFLFIGKNYCQSQITIGDSLQAKLDQIATMDVPKDAPGIATGIIYKGDVIYKNYAGFSDLEKGVAIGKKSRFNIASNGKQFTALAILLLQEEGLLSLEDDLRQFYPDLYPEISDPIKISHLINHSSGIRDVYDLWSLQGITWWKQTLSNKEAMDLLSKQTDLNFTPGSKYLYSNSNYILLAEIIDQVAPEGFIQYTNKLFQSLDMPNTSFTQDYRNISGEIAKPYFNFDTWTDYKWTCNIIGDGNLFSTLEDQLQWEKIIQRDGDTAIPKSIIKQSQSLLSNSNIDQYGYGLEFSEHKKQSYTFHAGSTGAWKAFTARFEGGDISFITLTNSGKTVPSYQTMKMVDLLLGLNEEGTPFTIKPSQEGEEVAIPDIPGIYLTEGGYMMRFEEREGDLFLLRSGRNDMKLIRESSNVFHQWNDEAFKQEFIKDKDGSMTITAYYTSHAPYTLTRLEEDLSNFDFNKLNGTFINSETEAKYKITHLQGSEYKIGRGKRKLIAFLVSPTQLMINDDKITFTIGPDGEINDFFLDSNRIRKVKFERK